MGSRILRSRLLRRRRRLGISARQLPSRLSSATQAVARSHPSPSGSTSGNESRSESHPGSRRSRKAPRWRGSSFGPCYRFDPYQPPTRAGYHRWPDRRATAPGRPTPGLHPAGYVLRGPLRASPTGAIYDRRASKLPCRSRSASNRAIRFTALLAPTSQPSATFIRWWRWTHAEWRWWRCSA